MHSLAWTNTGNEWRIRRILPDGGESIQLWLEIDRKCSRRLNQSFSPFTEFDCSPGMLRAPSMYQFNRFGSPEPMPQVECKQDDVAPKQPAMTDPEIDYIFSQMVLRLRTTYYALRGTSLH
jgi:hypothetical protein